MNNRLPRRTMLAFAVSTALIPLSHATDIVEEILIVGLRENRVSEGATGLMMDIKSTPQSISLVTREMMDSFGASDINSALDLVTGVQVERWETNRTNYLSRGFEIKNTQIDGVGLPNNWGLVTGAIDAFGYEKIEVIRGANGLLTGIGNASGTINYVRKRPLNTQQGTVRAVAASHDRYRLEADYSTPFTETGDWAGRVVVAQEEAGSWLRGMEDDRTFIYGVVDGQVSDKATLTAGYAWQEANTNGNMWGGLTFANSDGSQARWPRSASTAQDWSRWDTVNKAAFVEYNYHFASGWNAELSYHYRAMDDDSVLFFASTYTGLDPQTGAGLTGWPGKWLTEDRAHLVDLKVSGQYDFFGNTHDLVLGVSHSVGRRDMYTNPSDEDGPAFGPLPPFPYRGDAVPEPAWGPRVKDSRTDDELTRYYGVTRLHFGRFKTILGFNAINFERDATSQSTRLDEREVSPYVGLTVDITPNLLAYTSYSDIYEPQDKYDSNRVYLAPSKGVNYEVGVKAEWLDGRLLTTLALFKAKQEGLGVYAGFDPETAQYFYVGEDVDSRGYEMEIAGWLGDYLSVNLGFTSLDLEDETGQDTYKWVPRETVNFALNVVVPGYEAVTVGVGGRWRSKTSRVDGYTGVNIKQNDYLTVDTYARWQVDEHSALQLNIDNLTDEKYISSLYEIGYYAAPRTYSLTYSYTF